MAPDLVWASQVALVVKNPPANAGDARDSTSIPASGRSPGMGSGNPLQHSCLENFHGVGKFSWGRKESNTIEHTCARARAHTHTHTRTHTHTLQKRATIYMKQNLKIQRRNRQKMDRLRFQYFYLIISTMKNKVRL